MANIYPEIPVSDRRDAVSCVKYDHYLEDSSREIFKDGSKPLKEYLRMRSMAATPPCTTIRTGRLQLPGEDYVNKKWRFATEFGRKYTRSLLKALWHNEQNGESFSDFGMDNMLASRSGRAKFYGVKRMKRTGVQAKRNYNSALEIITALFSGSKGEAIPKDIGHLLSLIKDFPAKQELYHIHASLIPLSNRQAAYFKMYEVFTYKMTATEQDSILLELPYAEEWKQMLVGNRLLERIYKFNEKKYDATQPLQDATQPLQDAHGLTFEQQLEQRNKRKRNESRNMVAYMRHRTAHRMDDFQKEAKLGKPYEAEDTELVALVRYPLTLPHFQEKLYDAGKLDSMLMDELF